VAVRQFAESPESEAAKLEHRRLREIFEEYDTFLHGVIEHLRQLGAAVHVVTNNDSPAALGYIMPLYEHVFFPKTFGKTCEGGLGYTYPEGEGQVYDGGDATLSDTFHMKPHKTDPCVAGMCSHKNTADPLCPWIGEKASKADRYAAIMRRHIDRSVVIAVGDNMNADIETLEMASREVGTPQKLYGILFESLDGKSREWNRANADRVLKHFIVETVAKVQEVAAQPASDTFSLQLPRLALDLKIADAPLCK